MNRAEYLTQYWEIIHQWNTSSKLRGRKRYTVGQAISTLKSIIENTPFNSRLHHRAAVLMQAVISGQSNSVSRTAIK